MTCLGKTRRVQDGVAGQDGLQNPLRGQLTALSYKNSRKLPLHARLLRVQPVAMYGGYTYILTNRPQGTLYIGVTSELVKRVWEHRENLVEGFTARYGLYRLVHFECHIAIEDAIARERQLKRWHRGWKVGLVETWNPEWEDLYPGLLG